MSKTVDTFIALLRSVVTQTNEEIDLADVNYEALFSLSKFHDLAHIVYYELERRNALPEGKVLQEFKEQHYMAVFRHVKRTMAIAQIREILEKAQIPFILLKGAVLMDLYPEPWMRTSSDVDVLVRETDCDKASRILSNSGMAYTGKGSHDASFETSSKSHIELHFTLIEEYRRPQTVELLKEVWNYAHNKADCSEHFLSDEMFFYYHIAHMVKHFEEGGCGVRPFVDLWLLIRNDCSNRQIYDELLEKGGILTFAKRSIELANGWFSSNQRNLSLSSFADYVINGGVYGTMEQRVIAQSNKRNAVGLRYYLTRVFPPIDEMKGRYPIISKHPVLVPIYWIKRLFSLLGKDTRKRAKAEMNAEKAKDVTSAKRIESLMKSLEIW